MAKKNKSDLRRVTAAAIRLTMLEAADHVLLISEPIGELTGRTTPLERHQQLWARIIRARADLRAAVKSLR